jgi:hypothetical protein
MEDKELLEQLVRLIVVIAFGFVIRPLALLYGVNTLLESGGFGSIPYSLLAYLGVMLVLLAVKIDVKVRD